MLCFLLNNFREDIETAGMLVVTIFKNKSKSFET
jgi:hypothetical protein